MIVVIIAYAIYITAQNRTTQVGENASIATEESARKIQLDDRFLLLELNHLLREQFMRILISRYYSQSQRDRD